MGSDTNIAPRTQLYCVPASAGEVSELASLAGDAYYPAISPNGRWVAFVGTDVDDPPDEALARLFVASVDGHAPRCLTPDLERSVGCEGWADLVMAEDVPGPLWLDDESLLVLVSDRGRNVPHRADLNGQLEPVIPPGRLVGAALAAASGRIALAAGVDRHATEIYALETGAADAGAATLRQITRDGSAWQDQFAVPEWEELSIEGPGGPIQVWLASPRDARKTPLPTILAFHGGPTGAWAPGGTMDSTMLCGAGYRVALPNIRGSASFGSDWVAALGGRWGEVDAEDALAVADALVARGLADGQRLGMMGLSYGGYLVQWLAGATDRFGAGVAENGVANLVSGWANSYFGVHYHRHARLGDPLTDEGMQGLWRASPLRNAARIHTPLLILQAEEDRICEPADNEQLFTALKVLDRETEYILYPEEHHELKNYGRPDRRIDRMERHLAWFDRWLRPRATSGGG